MAEAVEAMRQRRRHRVMELQKKDEAQEGEAVLRTQHPQAPMTEGRQMQRMKSLQGRLQEGGHEWLRIHLFLSPLLLLVQSRIGQ
jgi:hypothetical protein